MRKTVIFGSIIILIILIVGIFVLTNAKILGRIITDVNSTELNKSLETSKPSAGTVATGKTISGTSTPKPQKITLEQYLSSQQIIKDLPKDAIILLKFYSYSGDEWVIDKSYILEKDSVKEGESDNADAVIFINSKYLGELGNGLCQTIKKAKENGDITLELKMKYSSFMWKYSSLLKYKDCFGM